MPIVADVADAVVGGDTHRDTHTLEIVTPAGVTLATTTIDNTENDYELDLERVVWEDVGIRRSFGGRCWT